MGMLRDKAVVITGSGRGLGRAYALAAAAAGARVVVNDVDAECAEEVVAAILAAGGRAVAHVGSVDDWNESAALIQRCIDEFGAIDGLVNNAGLQHVGDPQDETEALIRRDIGVNVIGVLFVATHAMKAMAGQRSGAIVNVTSGAHLGISGQGVYGASKGAVASATYSWSIDMAPHNVRVNAISPLAHTRIADVAAARMGISAADLAVPESIAPLIVFLLSDAANFSGQVVRLDGTTLNVLAQPRFRAETGVTRQSWTAESIADAWRSDFAPALEDSGMAAYAPPTD